MNAGDAGAACACGRGGDDSGEAGERTQSCVNGRGNGGGEEVGRAVCGEKFGDDAESLRRGFHHVVTVRSVDVYVEVGRRKGCGGKLQRLGAVRRFRLDAGRDRDDAAVFDHDDRVAEKLAGIPEPVRGECRTHGEDYCRPGVQSK